MLDLLWLLLPVAAASGWLAGRRAANTPSRSANRRLSSDYFRGLNHLLNEQPDKAIEVFIRMLEAEGETVEIHLALGSLFRRRGEVDRAIRIHQNLIARPTLNPTQRAEALQELGLDYARAGLYDRAEEIFLELAEVRAHAERALRELLEIYQQESEWDKAIDTARRLASRTGVARDVQIANYHCELADELRSAGEVARALAQVARALSVDPGCVRASLLQGDLESARGHGKAAVRAYRRVADQDPEYLPEVLERLQAEYTALGRLDELRDFLHDQIARSRAITPVLALAELMRQQQGERVAGEFIIQQLEERPSLRGLDRVIDLSLELTSGSTRQILEVLHRLVAQMVADKPFYRCGHCGFEGKTLHWQCPSCKHWSSVKPIQGIEGV
jgi:lipopolysaccharide biosynthesis regulator YciM